jgi:NAD(P)-dependent dehydrogenase (short-subunit alcohol dehydrogenase family)
MQEQRYGRIINMGADSVRNGLDWHAIYNAAKGGVHGLTTGWAREFVKDGITVNAIAPCATRTEAFAAFESRTPRGPGEGPGRHPGRPARHRRGGRLHGRLPRLRGVRVHYRPGTQRQRLQHDALAACLTFCRSRTTRRDTRWRTE